MRDLNSRLNAERKNLERTSKQADPREKEDKLQREMESTAKEVGAQGLLPVETSMHQTCSVSAGLHCTMFVAQCVKASAHGWVT